MGFGIQGEAYNYYMSLDDKTKEYVRGKLSFADFGKNGFASLSDPGAAMLLAGMQWFGRFYRSNNERNERLNNEAAEWRSRAEEARAQYEELAKKVSNMDEFDPEYKKTLAERELTFDHYQTLAYLAQDSEDYASSMNAIV